MTSILENDFSRLWKGKTEEAFHNLFYGVAYKFCENPANLKDASLKDCILQLLVVALRASKNNVQGVVSSVVDMIMKHEHVSSLFVEFIVMINKDNEEEQSHTAIYSSFVNQIFVEIGSIEDLNTDGTGTKLLSGFLCDVSERLPRVILANMSVLLPHLQSENYTIRNAILHGLSRVIHHLGNTNDTVIAKTRDQLLSILEERFRDVNAYTRSKVIQCWSYLCEHKTIPLKTLPGVIELVIGRLVDKSAFVRKSGVQFLLAILEYNPFGANLKLSYFKNGLEKWEKEKEALAQEEGEQQPQQTSERVRQFAYLTEAIRFIIQIHESIRAASDLLQSKTTSDVTEAIQFLCKCHQFGVESSLEGVKKMVKLVWSREQSVKDYVIEQFEYLMISGRKLNNPNACLEVAKDLIRVSLACNRAEQQALEAVMILVVHKNKFPKVLLLALWELFTAEGSSREERIGSALVISMVACARPEAARKKLKTLVKVGLAPSADLYLATYTCRILANLAIDDSSSMDENAEKKRKDDSDDDEDVLTYTGGTSNFKLKPDNKLFKRLTELILTCEGACLPFVEKALIVIFKLSEAPEATAYSIINSLATATKLGGIVKKPVDEAQDFEEPVEQEQDNKHVKVSSSALSKLLFVLGHSIMLECVNVELQFKKAKKHKQLTQLLQEQEENNKKQKKAAPAKKTKKGRKKQSSDEDEEIEEENATDKPTTIEAELGLDPNSMDDHELEEQFELRERNILSDQSVYGAFVPLLITLCTQEKTTPELTKCAVLALCKFMCVNQEFCDKYLQLLFTLLQNSANSDNFGLRSNIIVSIGDLACRFPNSVEPWIHHMYQCLRDNDRQVRKNTLMVLTHLALNDMIKIKSNMVELVKCIEDEDEEIANLSQAFFTELARKNSGGNNPIYNLIPEVLSRLSLEETERTKQGLEDDEKFRESFRNIMRFMLAFVNKDRQVEKLVEKLCQRFASVINTGDDKLSSSVVRQWRDIAYCLTLLPFNDKCVKKMIESEKHYQQAIADKEVFDTLITLSAKGKKGDKAEKGVDKEALAEWEQKVTDRHRKLCDDEVLQTAVSEAGTTATTTTTKKATRGKKKAPAKGGKKGGRRTKRKEESEEEDEVEEEEDDVDLMLDDEDEEEPAPKKTTRGRKAAPKKAQKKVESDEEAEEEEEEAPKARTTRARKNVVAYNDSDEDVEEEEEKPKRRAGRPAKKQAKESSEEEDKENDHPNVCKAAPTPKKKPIEYDSEDGEEVVTKAVKKAVTKGRAKTTTAKGKTSGVRKNTRKRV